MLDFKKGMYFYAGFYVIEFKTRASKSFFFKALFNARIGFYVKNIKNIQPPKLALLGLYLYY